MDVDALEIGENFVQGIERASAPPMRSWLSLAVAG
jgi:hypothetical protein